VVRYAFFIGAAAENAAQLGELERLPGCAGVKVFMGSSTGSLLVPDDAGLRDVLRNGRRRVAVHAEDEVRLKERFELVRAGGDVSLHPLWRDVETAVMATRRLLRLARESGRRVHVLHVTTAEEMEILAAAKDIATVEATPQHLTLAAPECYVRLGTFAQMNPPIREARHRDGLWRGIAQGIVDCIGSDHAPHTAAEKARPYPESPSGMPGVQTLLPLLLDHLNAGRLTLERLVDLTSAGPARIYNIAGKGRIAVGYDADLTLVDLKARRTISKDRTASKCGWTPFDGMAVTGWPRATVIRGRVVMREDELIGAPAGEPVRFAECL
jgi:dihydroorotase